MLWRLYSVFLTIKNKSLNNLCQVEMYFCFQFGHLIDSSLMLGNKRALADLGLVLKTFHNCAAVIILYIDCITHVSTHMNLYQINWLSIPIVFGFQAPSNLRK